MEIPKFIELFQLNIDLFKNSSQYVEKLNDDTITDKSEIEYKVSQNLEYYIENYSEQLTNESPQSLLNVLYRKNCDLNQKKIFEFIKKHYQKNNNSDIFVLLRLI